MKSIVWICIYALAFPGCTNSSPTVTTFILVRHAEKANDGTEDPDLNAAGLGRADRFATLLKESSIDAIYATNYKRTRNTVIPLATAKNLEVESYESFKNDEIERILTKHKGGTVVMCGHANNIPWTANLLSGKEDFEDYKESEYSILLIVSVVEKGKVAKITRLDF